MKDQLGDRMKSFYEDRTRTSLPRRTFTIIRIDGKAFHTYTRGLTRPFDQGLIDDMNETTKFLCESIQGAKFGYVQSDEISILLTDFEKTTTDAWFDGNIQKMASISASMATAKFNELRVRRLLNKKGNFYAEKIEENLLKFKSHILILVYSQFLPMKKLLIISFGDNRMQHVIQYLLLLNHYILTRI